ncbi:menaquinone biosynthetic enzyme MqnA/MqnD family protein [Aneurinibacillus thermoaerophilus]|uniref:Chorismate dehydratase n=1 Tax=Aneurinibacillus thermoaerophilus TaxID=143495 RepID=A0ABX8YDQ2_ANETH|nr:menaquinone biosynthesis protein [Aneurinibacillus thermoaerophilus]MED0679633.1 menaquinone biosynthesis protein [Aneurinibacillus thermoaerophilus]MED0737369.1 menaquinone biosynthesis protein [Aneurinibacillus thermoaerophilus]MED0756218.1 menaquinone biosynthesis protein [Aneurinibacillus thermoaerophilus]MED0760347.1 menaquinone biosynthesis protein [Aneurinibacillus thermoaerophilus]MED0764941.1 menaquinone biosynthesis protein [Aneurinibacillus thermoaerophilus]
MSSIKIGKITFSNIMPIYHFFRMDQFDEHQVEFIPQVPTQLNRGMAEGTIDMGPISSFEYGRNYKEYEVLPGLSISSLGKVRSIFLFSRKPIEELKEAKIALTDKSATSINLLRIIMEKFYQASPAYETMPANFEKMMATADAALLIGDDALLASWNNHGYYMYDLGELWYQHTGLWMVFAVWAVRREVTRGKPELLRSIHNEFLHSKKKGLAELDAVVAQAKKEFGATAEFWKVYYTGLSYDFTLEHKKGLEYYYACAADLGLLKEPAKVEVWNTDSNKSAV